MSGGLIHEEEREPGLGVEGTTRVIPDHERWLHEPTAAAALEAAMAWSVSHLPEDAELESALKRLGDGDP